MDQATIKLNWRQNWLKALKCLADLGLQNERWLDPRITNPGWTFVEFMCGYFDDLITPYEGYDYLVSHGYVSVEEFQSVKDFHDALDAYKSPTNNYDHAAIVADPQWIRTAEIGKQSLTALKGNLRNASEIMILNLYPPMLTEKDFTWPN